MAHVRRHEVWLVGQSLAIWGLGKHGLWDVRADQRLSSMEDPGLMQERCPSASHGRCLSCLYRSSLSFSRMTLRVSQSCYSGDRRI
jgi:hypothetical protein